MIAVTGASGHLGQWVVQALAAEGHDVLCISRNPATTPSIHGITWSGSIEALAADLSDDSFVEALAPYRDRITGVVHSAAFIPESTADNRPEEAAALLAGNVQGTIRLQEALASAPALAAIVNISSFEVYGPPESDLIGEAHATNPLSHYGASKLMAEKYLHLFGQVNGIPVCSLRLPAVYGPGDRIKRAIGNFILRAADGESLAIFGDGEDRRDLVYAGDAADAVIRALRLKAEGLFNIGSGAGYRIRDVAEAVQTAAPTPIRIDYHAREKPRLDYRIDTRRALDMLGWEPATPLAEGIRKQLEWVLYEKGV